MNRKYLLMQKDYPVLEVIFNEDTGLVFEITEIIDKDRVPLDTLAYDNHGIVSGINIDKINRWWTKRGLPEKRDEIGKILSFLDIKERTKLQMLNNGLSLSDTYWIKPPASEVRWKDINFFTNDFSYDIGTLVFGHNKKERDKFDTYSPDLSTNGWLKKTWIIKNQKRYLIKAGSNPEQQEPINEILASKMLEALNFVPFVKYHMGQIKDKPCSTCRNFLDENTEYVPAYLIYRTEPRPENTTVYSHLINMSKKYNLDIEDFIDRMLQVDYIMGNSDRHLGNFGFLRDVETLKIIGPAPLFDNGTSLWNKEATEKIMQALNLSKPFAPLHEEQIRYINNFYITPEFLSDIPDIFEEIMNLKTKMSKERIKRIRQNLQENINSYEKIYDKLPPERRKKIPELRKNMLYAEISESKKKKGEDELDKFIKTAKMNVRAKNMLKEKNNRQEENVQSKMKHIGRDES